MLVTIIALLARDFDELILYFFGNEFLHAVLSVRSTKNMNISIHVVS